MIKECLTYLVNHYQGALCTPKRTCKLLIHAAQGAPFRLNAMRSRINQRPCKSSLSSRWACWYWSSTRSIQGESPPGERGCPGVQREW